MNTSPLHQAIDAVKADTKPFSRERTRALKSIHWVLATDDDQFVSLIGEALTPTLTREPKDAAVFSAADNEEVKATFFQALLDVPLHAVLLEQ